MGFGKIIRFGMWLLVAIFIILFTVLIIIGHANSFDFYYAL